MKAVSSVDGVCVALALLTDYFQVSFALHGREAGRLCRHLAAIQTGGLQCDGFQCDLHAVAQLVLQFEKIKRR